MKQNVAQAEMFLPPRRQSVWTFAPWHIGIPAGKSVQIQTGSSLSALKRADCGSPHHPQKHIGGLYLPYVLPGDPPRCLVFSVGPCSEWGFKTCSLERKITICH